jgi:TonB-linked SusC/RagA family outer membrane protein
MKKKRNGICFPKESMLKILLRMKLLTVFILVAMASASAKTYSQQTKFELKLKEATVQTVFQKIEENSEFILLYDEKTVDVNRKVDIMVKNEPVESILDQVFKGTKNTYKIYDRQIVILERTEPRISSKTIKSKPEKPQKKEISGIVTDEKGDPIPGVSVVVKGTTIGITTNSEGKYLLEIPLTAKKILFSFIGMEKQEVVIGNQTSINITMVVDAVAIGEVVAIGYGTQRKIDLTGSVEVVNLDKDIGKRSTSSVTSMLQGSMSGLTVTHTNNSGGEPGATQNLSIRGAGTLTGGGGSPYILVDGFPIDVNQMNALNPEDLETVTILKDAASCAIYGSKGAFGVILITTKSGKLKTPTVVKYSAYTRFTSPTFYQNMPDALEFVTAINQSCDNSNYRHLFADETITKIKAQMNGELDYETEVMSNGRWSRYFSGFANNDWAKIIFKKHSIGTNHNLSVRGGENKTAFYISGNYFTREGNINFVKNEYDRYNFQAKISQKATDWLSFEVNSSFSKQIVIMPSGPARRYSKNLVYHSVAQMFPTEALYDPEGNIINFQILQLLGKNITSDISTSSAFQIATILEPIKNWKTKVSYNWSVGGRKQVREMYENNFKRPNGQIINLGYRPNGIFKRLFQDSNELFNVVSSYKPTINKNHNVFVLVGFEQRLRKYSYVYGDKKELLTESVPSLSTATGEQVTNDWSGSAATQGVFGRVTYDYKHKYLFQFNARYDGSSFFRRGRRWGFFPSASVGYNISEEGFWKPIKPIVNRLKFKFAYGELGNHSGRLAHLYKERLSQRVSKWIIDGEKPYYLTAPDIVSPGLTWETVVTTNLGMEAGFFNNKLSLDLDIYKRVTTNMIGPESGLPAILGAAAPKENNAEYSTKGWELKLNWRSNFGKVKYRVGFNLSDDISTITEYKSSTGALSYYNTTWGYKVPQWRKGQRVGEIWGYKSLGYFKSDEAAAAAAPSQTYMYNKWGAGDMQYADLNDDGKIDQGKNTIDDHGDLMMIGNDMPRYNFGINMGVSYKGFDLSVLLQGVGKRDFIFHQTTKQFYGFVGRKWWNVPTKASLDYWTPENTDAYFPKPYMSKEHFKNTQRQTHFLQDASYVRLKNVQLSYTFPNKILKKIDLKVYYSGENLFLLTNINENFDPEILVGNKWGAGKTYPLNKVHSFGMVLSF